MTDWLHRTELLFGEEKMHRLKNSHVLVAGLGGVGGIALEIMARTGIGKFTIVDFDTVHETNINRQIIATIESLGQKKTLLWKERLLSINPGLNIDVLDVFLKDEAIPQLFDQSYDYVVDAIDTLSPKVFFIYHAMKSGCRLVSSMGSGSKTDPTQIRICDISQSYNDPLAYYVRKKLHKLSIFEGFNVVFSPETEHLHTFRVSEGEQNKKSQRGTIAPVVWGFGSALASDVINNI